MYQSFDDIEKHILGHNLKKRIALAGAHDADALESVVMARRKGAIEATLIGDVPAVKALLSQMGESEDVYQYVQEENGAAAAMLACRMVKQGDADMPMKGKMATADFMRAILNKEFGFIPPKGLLCQATVLEFLEEKRLLVISDCAVNIAPTYEEKKVILENAVVLAKQLGIQTPKVAVITPLEVVNPSIQATVDAAMLAKAAQRGQITGCVVDGPLALDNAINAVAAAAKGVGGDVAGHADVLIMPDLCTGNVFTKSLHYFAHLRQTGSVTGAATPVVMTSRTDTPEDKYFSILVSVLQSL